MGDKHGRREREGSEREAGHESIKVSSGADEQQPWDRCKSEEQSVLEDGGCNDPVLHLLIEATHKAQLHCGWMLDSPTQQAPNPAATAAA